MDFISENLLTILILLPVFGAVATLAASDVLEAGESAQVGDARLHDRQFLAVAATCRQTAVRRRQADSFLKRTYRGSRRSIPTYHVGVDGLSLWLVILTTFIMPIAVLSTWHAVEKRRTAFYIFLLLLESAMIGVFVSLDLLVFYLFFEASLVPMFFLIGIWGGENRIYAAVKFFIFTALGSLLMLVAIIALYYVYADQTGARRGTFDYVAILNAMKTGTLSIRDPRPERCCFSHSRSRSRSRFRSSRSTRGCRMHIPKPRPPVPLSWPLCCSRWELTA